MTINEELTNKRAKRLHECRIYRKMTQAELAEKSGYATSNAISQLEKGARPITWDKAAPIAKALNVNPAYIMGESDIRATDHPGTASFLDKGYFIIDLLFLSFLKSKHHRIVFRAVKLYTDTFETIDVSHNDLLDFSLSDPRCRLVSGKEQSEVIIKSVLVDGKEIPFGRFVFVVNRLYDYIDFTIKNIEKHCDDLDVQQSNDRVIQYEIEGLTHRVFEDYDSDLIHYVESDLMEYSFEESDPFVE